jgi:hypothetical protein
MNTLPRANRESRPLLLKSLARNIINSFTVEFHYSYIIVPLFLSFHIPSLYLNEGLVNDKTSIFVALRSRLSKCHCVLLVSELYITKWNGYLLVFLWRCGISTWLECYSFMSLFRHSPSPYRRTPCYIIIPLTKVGEVYEQCSIRYAVQSRLLSCSLS